jgi:aldose 1-epimerase
VTAPLRIGADDRLTVEIAPLGARITSIKVATPEGVREVTRGIVADAEYLAATTYQGSTVGRVANRIAGGDLPLGGRRYELPTNDRGSTLHGGPDGFHSRPWDVVEHTADRVVLSLVSPDGDQGFPGTVTVRATFAVAGGALRTTYEAETDAPTVVSLACHPYFALAERITEHRLRVAASSYLPTDATGIPTVIHPVAGSPFDLRESRPVDLAFDHCWVLDGTGFREVAELRGGGLRVTLATDQPGLQVYAGGGVVPGIALEPQGLPDAVHHPDWPSVELHPGERYGWRSEITVRAVTTRP